MSALLVLQVNFVGTSISIPGSSSSTPRSTTRACSKFTLTGDMAVRFYWKRNANLLLTVGGFHPAYTPPPMNLGALARLSMCCSTAIPTCAPRRTSR